MYNFLGKVRYINNTNKNINAYNMVSFSKLHLKIQHKYTTPTKLYFISPLLRKYFILSHILILYNPRSTRFFLIIHFVLYYIIRLLHISFNFILFPKLQKMKLLGNYIYNK